jgi:hypothetical protein
MIRGVGKPTLKELQLVIESQNKQLHYLQDDILWYKERVRRLEKFVKQVESPKGWVCSSRHWEKIDQKNPQKHRAEHGNMS